MGESNVILWRKIYSDVMPIKLLCDDMVPELQEILYKRRGRKRGKTKGSKHGEVGNQRYSDQQKREQHEQRQRKCQRRCRADCRTACRHEGFGCGYKQADAVGPSLATL